MRIEHWDVAFNQGKTAAFNMLGRGLEHDVVPYFFSDLADWVSMEYVGPGSGDLVVRGSMEEHAFTAFYMDDGRVVAALTVGRSDDLEHAGRFLTEHTKVDPAALADLDTDLALAVARGYFGRRIGVTIFRNLLSGRRKSGRSSAPKMGPSTIVTKKNRTKAIARGSMRPALCSAACYR